jgi:hypothetical protein
VFGPIFKGIGIAASPKGRRMIRTAIVLSQTPQGKAMLAQARRYATSPESKRVLDQAMKAATRAGKTAGSAENRERLKAAAKTLRSKRSR